MTAAVRIATSRWRDVRESVCGMWAILASNILQLYPRWLSSANPIWPIWSIHDAGVQCSVLVTMILKTIFLHPLGPALILALGGAVLAVLRRIARRNAVLAQMIVGRPQSEAPKSRLVQVRLLVALLAVLLATALLLYLRTLSPRPVLAWTWQPLTVAGSVLEWRVDAWNWIAAAAILALTGVAALLGEVMMAPAPRLRLDVRGVDLERTLWLGAAALIFISSNNILTLASTWLILDAALAVRLHLDAGDASAASTGSMAQASGRAWSALTLSGMLILILVASLGETGIRAGLSAARLTELQIALLWIAALVRAGVYPFHIWLLGGKGVSQANWLPVQLIGATAGLWLLGRVHALAGPDFLRQPEWVALSALALLGTAIVAWTVEDGKERWRWIALNRASLAVMAAYTAAAPGPEALVWSLVTFSLGCALLAAGQATCELVGWRVPALLAALALWGMPATAGFLARRVLVFPTESAVAAPLFAVVMLAEVLLVAALWQAVNGDYVRRDPVGPPDRRRLLLLGVTIVILAIPLVGFGLFPRPLAALAGWPPADNANGLIAAIQQTRRSVWIGLLLAAAGGIALGIYRDRLLSQVRGWQAGIATIAGLEWLYAGLAAGFRLAGNGLRYFATLGEGEGYLGWLALAAFVLWVLLRG
jgi:hypothetical protein